MSLENAKRFIEAASKDQALQRKLGAAREPEELVRLAVEASSERGLPFTAAEFLSSLGPRPDDGGGALSDDQLGAVTGGTSLSPSQVAKWGQRALTPEKAKLVQNFYDSLSPSEKV